jgi:hypothetical protein
MVDSLFCVGRELKEVATVSIDFSLVPVVGETEEIENAVLASNLLADGRELRERAPPERVCNLLAAGGLLTELGTGTLVCNLLAARGELKETRPTELVCNLIAAGGPVKGRGTPTLDGTLLAAGGELEGTGTAAPFCNFFDTRGVLRGTGFAEPVSDLLAAGAVLVEEAREVGVDDTAILVCCETALGKLKEEVPEDVCKLTAAGAELNEDEIGALALRAVGTGVGVNPDETEAADRLACALSCALVGEAAAVFWNLDRVGLGLTELNGALVCDFVGADDELGNANPVLLCNLVCKGMELTGDGEDVLVSSLVWTEDDTGNDTAVVLWGLACEGRLEGVDNEPLVCKLVGDKLVLKEEDKGIFFSGLISATVEVLVFSLASAGDELKVGDDVVLACSRV